MYSKWDNLDDSDDEADNALEKAQALNERGSKLLTGQGKAPQPEAALECFEQAFPVVFGNMLLKCGRMLLVVFLYCDTNWAAFSWLPA